MTPGTVTATDSGERSHDPRADRRRLIWHLAGVIGATAVALAWSYRIWNLHPRRPLVYAGDGLSGFGNVETIDRTGWWTTNDQWGWPFGLKHYDFPLGGEHLHVLTIKFLGLFTNDVVLLTNTFFFGSFFAIALVCFLVARRLRLSPMTAGVVSILFTFLPFHFWHGTPHFYRTAYYLIPVGGLILLWLAGHDGGFFEGRSLRRRRFAFAVGISVLLAMTDTVAMAFPMALAAVIGMVALITGRGWRTLLIAVGLAGVMATTLLVNNLPTFIYQAENGSNPITLKREVSEQERYGLKVASLVLPQPEHPIRALADIGAEPYTKSLIPSEGGQSLGTAGTIGLISVVAALFGAALATKRESDESESVEDEYESSGGEDEALLRKAGVLVLSAIVFAVPTGLAFVLGMFGLEEFRTWNRIVIYIAFFSLIGFGVVIDRLRRMAERRGVAPLIIILVMALIASVGVWDQVPRTPPNFEKAAALFNTDAAFFSEVEAMYPDGGQIFALPIIPYPEPSQAEAGGAYRHMIPIIQTTRLDTSYGGMKGREWEWQRELARLPTELVIPALISAGFDGIYIDRWNYVDGGAAAETALTKVIGSAPSVDEANGAFAFWDLRSVESDLAPETLAALGRQITMPIVAMLGDGFYSKPRSNALAAFAGESAKFVIRNMTDSPHEMVTTIEVRTVGGTVEIFGPGEWDVKVVDGITTARAVQTLAPGDTPIEIRTDGSAFQDAGDPREIHMSVSVRVSGPLVDRLRGDMAGLAPFPAFAR